jgi:hypothetical protein
MNRTHLLTRFQFLAPLLSGILGIALMTPAVAFLGTALARLCFNAKTAYRYIAPSFLQTPFDLFAFHKAQFILGCLIIAALFNARSRSWLNAAILVQSALLLLFLFAYTCIQHLRY